MEMLLVAYFLSMLLVFVVMQWLLNESFDVFKKSCDIENDFDILQNDK